MNKFTKNYLYNVSYKLLVLLAPLITVPYLARVLGAENLGIYSYIYSVTSLLSTVGLIGLYNYGVRQIAYFNNDTEMVSKIFYEIMVIRTILFGIGTVCYLIICLTTSHFIYFLIYFGWFVAAYFDISWLYVGLEDMRYPVIKNTFAKVAGIVCTFIFVKSKDDLWIYILLLSLSTFAANFSLFFTLNKQVYIKRYKLKLTDIFKYLRESFMLFIPQVAIVLYTQIDKIIIELITKSTSQISFLDQSEKIISIPLSFITVLSTILMPRMAVYYKNDNKESISKLITVIGEVTLMIALPMMTGIMAITNNFILWYLGDEFSMCIISLYILAPLIVINSMNEISGSQYYTATNQIKILIISYSTALVIKIILDFILIAPYGFIGAAISTLISSLISMMIQYIRLSKQVDISVFKKMFFKYLAYSLVMGIAVYIPALFIHRRILLTVLQIIIGGILYILILFVSKNKLLTQLMHSISLKKNK